MARITRFSLVYDGDEDRLAWDMVDGEGATTRLWLTQKLCRKLVGAVAQILEQRTAARAAHGAALQSLEQAAAMSEFGKLPGVSVSAESTAGLVRSVRIDASDRGMTLTFDFGAGETRELGLDTAAVRQSLAVMHRLHKAAGWPMDFWPTWVADPAAPARAGALN